MSTEAMERCAYCHADAPVTYYDVGDEPDAPLTARIPICKTCFERTSR